MMIEIHDDLNADEYNKLRVEVGWEIKNPLIVEKAIRNSTIRGMEKVYKSCGFEVVPFGYNGKGMRMKIEK